MRTKLLYLRVGALARLGRDTALVQCWSSPVGQALAQMLARSMSRAFAPLEEALMLRELIDSHGLSQREANERDRECQALRLACGPERELVDELGHLHALLGRVRRRLEHIDTPLAEQEVNEALEQRPGWSAGLERRWLFAIAGVN